MRAVLSDYQAHSNMARPYQGIVQRVPADGRDAHSATVTNVDPVQIRPKTRPQRPDERICARRLTLRRPAGQLPNSIFERGGARAFPARSARSVSPGRDAAAIP